MRPNLIVLRAADAVALSKWYSMLGCAFEKHSHNGGPEHFAHESSGVTFEIYASSESNAPTTGVRLGFAVESVVEAIERVQASEAGRVVAGPKESPWGRRAVLEDPECHRIEIVEAGNE